MPVLLSSSVQGSLSIQGVWFGRSEKRFLCMSKAGPQQRSRSRKRRESDAAAVSTPTIVEGSSLKRCRGDDADVVVVKERGRVAGAGVVKPTRGLGIKRKQRRANRVPTNFSESEPNPVEALKRRAGELARHHAEDQRVFHALEAEFPAALVEAHRAVLVAGAMRKARRRGVVHGPLRLDAEVLALAKWLAPRPAEAQRRDQVGASCAVSLLFVFL